MKGLFRAEQRGGEAQGTVITRGRRDGRGATDRAPKMTNSLTTLLSSKKRSVRMLLGGIGAAAAILALNVVDAKAQDAEVSPLETEMMNAAPELFGFLKGN